MNRFLTPLPGNQLFVSGTVFPAAELTRRVLTLFWRDCCEPAELSRAPAPVIQFAGKPGRFGFRPLRAWWLLEEGIVLERDGPRAESLEPFFGGETRGGLCPRYEFRIFEQPYAVAYCCHRAEGVVRGHRIRLAAQDDGRVRVLGDGLGKAG